MAVKEAAKKSPLDTNRAIAGFYFHRLLCRVFSDPDSPFVLKGGQACLPEPSTRVPRGTSTCSRARPASKPPWQTREG